MGDLKTKMPFDGMVTLRIGTVTFTPQDLGPLTSLAPYKGQSEALSARLEQAHGVAFPAPNRLVGAGGVQTQWFGYDQAMLIGAAPDAGLAEHAALTDQSDAWAVATLEGEGAADVLARLTPLDLRAHVFGVGHAARTDLMHMAGAVARVEAAQYRLMVFRSMAQTLLHDVQRAMEAVAARR